MRDSLKHIPEPLKRQLLLRLGLGIAALLVSILLLLSLSEPYSVLSGLAVAVFCAVSLLSLFRRTVTGDYVVISGECRSVMRSLLRKRTKAITLLTEDNKTIQVQIRQRLKRIKTGSIITLYVASSTPVYERDGAHLLYSYITIDVKGGTDND